MQATVTGRVRGCVCTRGQGARGGFPRELCPACARGEKMPPSVVSENSAVVTLLQPEQRKSTQQKRNRGLTFSRVQRICMRVRVCTEYAGDTDASKHDAASAHSNTVAFLIPRGRLSCVHSKPNTETQQTVKPAHNAGCFVIPPLQAEDEAVKWSFFKDTRTQYK